MSPDDFRRIAKVSDRMAKEYRQMAAAAMAPETAERHLRSAVNREADAEFYRSRADILDARAATKEAAE